MKAGAVASDPSDFGLPVVERVAAEPYSLPGPIHRRTSRTIRETLTIREAVSEIEPGVFFPYMTFDGQIPGRMLRVLDVKGPEQAGIFRNSSDAEPLTS